MADEAVEQCGFPNSLAEHKEPCSGKVIEHLEFDVEGQTATFVVPTCEFHYYSFLRMADWMIANLIAENKLKGFWKKDENH